MVPLEKAVIARLQSHGEKFEVLVEPYLSAKFKEGQKLDISEILASEDIYKDSGKGEKVPDELLEKVFGTTNKKEVAKKIVLTGTVQLTSQQRKEMKEQKRKQIISLIARNTINPQTDTPHPPNRIEKAMEEVRANIDIYKSAEEHIPGIIKDIRKLIPIKFEKRDIAVRIPAEYSTTAYHSVSNYGTIKREEWQSDGSLVLIIEIPSGIETEFYGHLNKITKGNVQTKILKRY
jgi:ribosome maturation protein SDO1